MTDFWFRRLSTSHQIVFLVLRPKRYELTWLHQFTSVEQGMTLLSARIIELWVQYDDDEWILLGWTKTSSELLRHLLFLQVEPLPYCLVRFSLLTVGSRLRSLCDNFGEPSAKGNTNAPSLWVIRTSFAFSLLVYTSDAPNFFPILQYQQSECHLSKFSPSSKRNPDRFLVVLSFRNDEFTLCLSLGVWEIFHQCAKWNNWSLKWFTESSFVRSFPVCQEILDISQMAIAFHRIWPPLFIQSRLQ